MSSVRRFNRGICVVSLSGFFFVVPHAFASTLTEDFSTLDHADLSASSGIWNTVKQQAQAGAVDNGAPSTAISFGDGSDGVLNSSTGFAFNTDSHPNGYQFQSVNISGGSITVTGSKPLIIRSLSNVTIAPAIDVSGGSGTAGQASPSNAGPNAGSAISSVVNGGAGGAAFSTAISSQLNGGNGENADGSFYTNSTGTGSIAAGTAGGKGKASTNVPLNFDNGQVVGGFASGTGGGGGGGFWVSNADAATGGGGGAGGGSVLITALGAVSVGSINANGGNGGAAVTSTLGTKCSGPGAGGNGGAIWIQSLTSISGPAPSVNGGNGGAFAGGAGCTSTSNGFAGLTRADAPAGQQPGWGTSNSDPSNAATNQTYVVQSTAYDLMTYNASFSSTPTIVSNASNGTIAIAYAGSADGTSFSNFTSSISSLSNRGYRFLKFQITLTTGGSAAASPTVKSISVSYDGPSLQTVDNLSLSAGCASLARRDSKGGSGGSSSGTGMMMLSMWGVIYLLIWQITRRQRA